MANDIEVDYLKPYFIAINEGTNDQSATDDAFKTAYRECIEKIRIKYPQVPIFCMIPFGQYKASAIREVCNDFSSCVIVETSDWNVTLSDQYHPNLDGGIVAGEKLAEVIKGKLSW